MKKQVQPTLIIGLGGTGAMALSEIKKKMYQEHLNPENPFPLVRFLAIDTEFITQSGSSLIKSKFAEQQHSDDNSYAKEYEIGLSQQEQFSIEVHKSAMKDFLKHPEKVGASDFVDASKMKRVIQWVQGDGAGGCGIVGKLAAWQNITTFKERLTAELNLLNNMDFIRDGLHPYKDYYELSSQHQLNIIVVCSLGGGTGKGIFLTVGVLIRELLLKMGVGLSDGAEIILVNYTPSCFTVSGRKVSSGYFKTIQANQYASLKELEFVLKYGYPIEKRLRQELNLLTRVLSEKIYTNVLLVSTQLDSNGIYIGDYQTINQSVASILTSYVFGNMIAEFRAYFRSNKGAYIGDNPIFENNNLQQERVRDYGRLGYYRLHLPLDQLFNFSKAYFATELLKNICEGPANPIPAEKRMSIEVLAGEMMDDFLQQSQHLLPVPSFITFQHLSQNCSTFDHAWLANIQEAIRGCFNSLSVQFFKRMDAQSPIEQKIEGLIKRLVDENSSNASPWKARFRAYAFQYGLTDTLALLDQLQTLLSNKAQEEFAPLLPKSSKNPYYQKHFVFGQNDKALLQVLLKQQNLLEDELLSYANGIASAFREADAALQEDRSQWQQRNKGWWKWIIGQEEKNIRKAKGAIHRLILSARQIYEKYVRICRSRVLLETLINLHHILFEMQQNIEKNLQNMQGNKETTTAATALLPAYELEQKKIVNAPKSSLEIRITGDQKSTFIDFAKQLRFDKEILVLPTLYEQLRGLVDKMMLETVAPEMIVEQLKEVTARLDELKQGQSLNHYLREQINTGAAQTVKNNLQQLQRNASFLGKLDTATVEGGMDKTGFSRSIIQAQDPQLIHHTFPDIFDANTKVVPTDQKDSIVLTKLETALPLFIFQEYRAAQKVYFQLENTETGLYEKHSHFAFVDLPEPFGITTELDSANLEAFILVLQHLNIIQFKNGYVQYQLQPWKSQQAWHYLIDEQKDSLKYLKEERQISFNQFLEKINHRKKWFDLLASLVQGLLERTFSLPQKSDRLRAINYLARYFNKEVDMGKGFPPFPPVLLEYLIKRSQSPALKTQLEEWKWFNLRKFQEWKLSPFYKLASFPNSIEKLNNWFEAPKLELLRTQQVIPLKVVEKEKKKKIVKKENPSVVETTKKYLAATTKKEYAKKMTVEEIVRLIKKEGAVVVSENGKKYDDWKNWKEVPAIVKAMRKAG
jgi:hypothetical protein